MFKHFVITALALALGAQATEPPKAVGKVHIPGVDVPQENVQLDQVLEVKASHVCNQAGALHEVKDSKVKLAGLGYTEAAKEVNLAPNILHVHHLKGPNPESVPVCSKTTMADIKLEKILQDKDGKVQTGLPSTLKTTADTPLYVVSEKDLLKSYVNFKGEIMHFIVPKDAKEEDVKAAIVKAAKDQQFHELEVKHIDLCGDVQTTKQFKSGFVAISQKGKPLEVYGVCKDKKYEDVAKRALSLDKVEGVTFHGVKQLSDAVSKPYLFDNRGNFADENKTTNQPKVATVRESLAWLQDKETVVRVHIGRYFIYNHVVAAGKVTLASLRGAIQKDTEKVRDLIHQKLDMFARFAVCNDKNEEAEDSTEYEVKDQPLDLTQHVEWRYVAHKDLPDHFGIPACAETSMAQGTGRLVSLIRQAVGFLDSDLKTALDVSKLTKFKDAVKTRLFVSAIYISTQKDIADIEPLKADVVQDVAMPTPAVKPTGGAPHMAPAGHKARFEKLRESPKAYFLAMKENPEQYKGEIAGLAGAVLVVFIILAVLIWYAVKRSKATADGGQV